MADIKHNNPDIKPAETLVSVTSARFSAGIVIVNGICTEAAPILKWCIGQSRTYLSRQRRELAREFLTLARLSARR